MNLKEITTNPGIYSIVDVLTQRKYIGMTKNLKTRINTHVNTLRNGNCVNKYLQRDYDKFSDRGAFGTRWAIEVLECHLSYNPEYLLIREKYWMLFHYPNVYNKVRKRDIGYNYNSKDLCLENLEWETTDVYGNNLLPLGLKCENKTLWKGFKPQNYAHSKIQYLLKNNEYHFSKYYLNVCKQFYVIGGTDLKALLDYKIYLGLSTK